MLKTTCRILLFLLGSVIFINGFCLLIFASATVGTFLTILLGLFFLLPSVLWNKLQYLLSFGFFKLFTAFAVVVVLSAVCITAFLFIYGNTDNVDYNEDYLIVLGCGLQGESPTAPLVRRLDTAVRYAERNPGCKIIVSGGQGNGESIPEAEAMYRYLTSHNIDADRIIKEDKSTSTTENFKYSARAADNDLTSYSAAFITNDFHIYRAEQLAKLLGYDFTHIHADTDFYNIIPSSLREILAIVKMYVFNN